MATAPRTFNFTTIFASAVPEAAFKNPIANRDTANDLPFKGWFDGNREAAREGKLATTFVPFAYFSTPVEQGGRGIDAKKVDGAYVKGKLRDQFNGWQAKTKKVITAAVKEPGEEKVDKNGKTYTAPGKIVTPEVSENVERGGLMLAFMERTGKEKDLTGQKELGITEPGIQMWLIETKEAKAAREAAAAAAEANKS